MNELETVLTNLVEQIRHRFESNEKHIQHLIDAIKERDQLYLVVQKTIVAMEKQIIELQSNAADKILLEDKNVTTEHKSILGSEHQQP